MADHLVSVAQTTSTNTLARELITDGTLTSVLRGQEAATKSQTTDASTDGEQPSQSPACSEQSPVASAATAHIPVVVVAADLQTAGRGRLDHTWVSRPGESMTVSFVVPVPRALAADESVNGWLQMIAGLATLDGLDKAILQSGARANRDDCSRMLKWPNDVFVHGLKLGGILAELVPLPCPAMTEIAESSQQGSGVSVPQSVTPTDPQTNARPEQADTVAIIFGIGLNLRLPASNLPTPQSTSLHLHIDGLPSGEQLRDMVCAGIVSSLKRRIAEFVADPHNQAGLVRDEVERVCWTLGRRVEAHYVDGTTLEGEAIALNADASLTMRADDGQTHVVRTADVGVLPQQ